MGYTERCTVLRCLAAGSDTATILCSTIATATDFNTTGTIATAAAATTATTAATRGIRKDERTFAPTAVLPAPTSGALGWPLAAFLAAAFAASVTPALGDGAGARGAPAAGFVAAPAAAVGAAFPGGAGRRAGTTFFVAAPAAAVSFAVFRGALTGGQFR